MPTFSIYSPARYMGVFLIVVAVLWIPLLFAAIWSIFNSHRYIVLFCLGGIGAPLLIATYCLFARLHFRRSFDLGANVLFYAYLGIPICVFLSIIVLSILGCINQRIVPLALLGALSGYVAVLQCFLCSVLECRQTLEKDQPARQYPLLAWAALLFSIDALGLIVFFTFVIRQLLLM